jgi:hypothetical protein
LNVIAVSGKTASGKTSLCRELVRQLRIGGYTNWRVVSIAAEVKNRAGALFNVEVTAENKAVFRPLLQAMADVNIAVGNPERWVRWLLNNQPRNMNLIIDDVRFPYELEFLKNEVGVSLYTVRLEVPEWLRVKRYEQQYKESPSAAVLKHYSETGLDEYDNWDIDYWLMGDVGTYELAQSVLRQLADKHINFEGGNNA